MLIFSINIYILSILSYPTVWVTRMTLILVQFGAAVNLTTELPLHHSDFLSERAKIALASVHCDQLDQTELTTRDELIDSRKKDENDLCVRDRLKCPRAVK